MGDGFLISRDRLYAVVIALLLLHDGFLRLSRLVFYDQAFGIHPDGVRPPGSLARPKAMANRVSQRTPAYSPFQRIESSDELHKFPTTSLEDFMMRDQKAGFAQQRIECEVLQTVGDIPPGEDWKCSVLHDRNAPKVGDRRIVLGSARWGHFGIHSCDKTVQLQRPPGFW